MKKLSEAVGMSDFSFFFFFAF